jgi:hypothetical protein
VTTEYGPLVSDEPKLARIMAASVQQRLTLPDGVYKDEDHAQRFSLPSCGTLDCCPDI